MALLVVSYSRLDAPQVRAIVKLLQGSVPDIERAVYWDDEFRTGEEWFEQFKRYVNEAPQVFVFWCFHSSKSAAVQNEYQYALSLRKRIVPVLLDDTPLAKDLAPIHGIDLRPVIRHSRFWRSARTLGAVGATLLACAVLLIGVLVLTEDIGVDVANSVSSDGPLSPQGQPVLPSPVADNAMVRIVLDLLLPISVELYRVVLPVGLVLAAIVVIVQFPIRRRRRRKQIVSEFAHYLR